MREPDSETSGFYVVLNRDAIILEIQNQGFLSQVPTFAHNSSDDLDWPEPQAEAACERADYARVNAEYEGCSYWEFHKIRGPRTDPKTVGLLL